jgi:hypothetical protein
MSKLIHIRHGGIVAVAHKTSIEGEQPMTALHVQGYDMPDDLADAEVRLTPDEVGKLVRELVQGLPPGERPDLSDLFTTPG